MPSPAPGPMIPFPLDEPTSNLWDAHGLVFERGVEIRKTTPEPNRWAYMARGDSRQAGLAFFTSELGLSIVQLVVRDAEGIERRFLMPKNNGPVLDLQIQQLEIIDVDGRFWHDVLNLRYILEATLYHCHGLVRQYLEVLYLVTHGGRNLNLFSDDFLASGAVAPYFEFEALVTAVVRAFDTVRFPVWRAFGSDHGCPNQFERCIEALPALPSALESILTEGLALYRRAKEYRDCCQHNAHFGAALPFARVQYLHEQVWSVLALLPDNPEVKAYSRFTYKTRIDALSYGWLLTNETFGCLRDIVRFLPKSS